jgi:hypothetical protein
MTEWARTSRVSINIKKCTVMHDGRRIEENPCCEDAGWRGVQATKEKRDTGIEHNETRRTMRHCCAEGDHRAWAADKSLSFRGQTHFYSPRQAIHPSAS